MEVTTFVEPEKASLIIDPEAWNTKVEELGLEGQKEIVAGGKANPFMRMDAGLVRVFETLCPKQEPIEKFSAEPIPLQALSMYGLAKLEGYFTAVEVWYSPGQPDPIMVGEIGREKYLMAQWGPEKISLDECRRRAVTKWKEKTKARLNKTATEVREALGGLDALATQYFEGEWVHIPS